MLRHRKASWGLPRSSVRLPYDVGPGNTTAAAAAEPGGGARDDSRRGADLARRDLPPGRDLEADGVAGAALAARGRPGPGSAGRADRAELRRRLLRARG